MCIRDSSCLHVVNSTCVHTVQTVQWLQYSTLSVSYTHLRAHETVLDLVCRLLLEKKHFVELVRLFMSLRGGVVHPKVMKILTASLVSVL